MATTYTGNKVFAPAVFLLAFREALEAALVIGILLGMLETLVRPEAVGSSQTSTGTGEVVSDEEKKREDLEQRGMVKRLRKIVLLGAFSGLFVAFCIGAAFLAIFYTQTNDLFGNVEELWEGIFNLIAVILITPMSLAILRADRSRAKWRAKLHNAFSGIQANGKHTTSDSASSDDGDNKASPTAELPSPSAEKKGEPVLPTLAQRNSSYGLEEKKPKGIVGRVKALLEPFVQSRRGALTIFLIPFVTTLREGLEGVVFIGGVSLGLPATSIPLPAILGLATGLLCGFLVFRLGSFAKIRIFLIASTCALLILASGMASRAVYYLQFYRYIQLVGGAAAESGSGPGSYYHAGYIWHLDCCNPEVNGGGSGWAILNSLVGWNNTATYGSVLMYVFYWLAIIAYIGFSAWKEGRMPRTQRYTARQAKLADLKARRGVNTEA